MSLFNCFGNWEIKILLRECNIGSINIRIALACLEFFKDKKNLKTQNFCLGKVSNYLKSKRFKD